MKQQVVVASVQFAPELLNVDKNLAIAKQLAFEAAAKGAQLVVLPELCISGFGLTSVKEAARCAQERNGYQTKAMQAIAEQFGCHVVFGYVELYEGKFYNAAAVVGPQGLVGNTQKHNRFGNDNNWATASECMDPVAITAAGRTGVLICRDSKNNFRETYAHYKPNHKFYKKGSVDTICLLTNWGNGFSFPDSAWTELSEGTSANVIVSNRVGKDRDLKFKGGSCICTRSGVLYTFGSSFTEAAVVGGLIEL